MRCVHCAKNISIIAEVCPHCLRSTEQSRECWGKDQLFGIIAIIAAILVFTLTKSLGWSALAFLAPLVFRGFTIPRAKQESQS